LNHSNARTLFAQQVVLGRAVCRELVEAGDPYDALPSGAWQVYRIWTQERGAWLDTSEPLVLAASACPGNADLLEEWEDMDMVLLFFDMLDGAELAETKHPYEGLMKNIEKWAAKHP